MGFCLQNGKLWSLGTFHLHMVYVIVCFSFSFSFLYVVFF